MEQPKSEINPSVITLKVTAVLERLEVPYFIAGSLASTFHGVVRTTQDADIVAQLTLEYIEPFIQLLQSEFYIDELMFANAIRSRSSFNILHKATLFKIDLFIPKLTGFVSKQFARARAEALLDEPGKKANVSSPEDTILAKLSWYDQGGRQSERQWRDVLGLIKIHRESMDLIYLKTTAAEIHLSSLLNKALSES